MKVTVASSSSFTFNRRWHLHLQMVGCDSTARAPFGCLQYYQDTSATISSFNYMSTASGMTNSIGVQGSRQIANMNYGTCVRAAPGQCSITWSLVSSFGLIFRSKTLNPILSSALRRQLCIFGDWRRWRHWPRASGNCRRSRHQLYHWLRDDTRLAARRSGLTRRSVLRPRLSWHNQLGPPFRHLHRHWRKRDAWHWKSWVVINLYPEPVPRLVPNFTFPELTKT